MSENILEIRNLNKSFGMTYANKDINFSVKRGEIRGLIGENGSGKSTLLSQIVGIYGSDSGEMFVNGEPYKPNSPLDAYDKKISMVLQELGVIGNLPISINVFFGRTKEFTKCGIISTKAIKKATEEVFKKWDLPMPPIDGYLGDMMIESRKMVELARALSIDPDILLLDELTQSLSLNNREKLYKLINKIKEMGRSVIVISHDVDELIAITDTITVLRDGEVVGNVVSAETTADDVKRMMVGRDVKNEYYHTDSKAEYSDEVVLSVDDISVAGEIEDISFDIHAGEILGFCGLSDSGIHSVGKAVFGLSKLSKGSVVLKADNFAIETPPAALKHGVGYVPKDRDLEALMIEASIRENFALPSLGNMPAGLGYVAPGKLKKLATDMVEQLSVKCNSIKEPMASLSGGNKQKVNLGRWVAKDLKLLILDCPTRGVDIGVKSYIYALMKEIKKQGIAMLLISDELTEVLGMADRLVVMKNGRMTQTIERGEDFTEQAVIKVMI